MLNGLIAGHTRCYLNGDVADRVRFNVKWPYSGPHSL